MIVADTGAILALIDRKDRHHKTLRELFVAAPDRWIVPWVILPEVDYLAGSVLGARAQDAFFRDIAEGLYSIEFGDSDDLERGWRIHTRHRAIRMGLVDAVVIAVAERLRASAIATLDLRHFGAVEIAGKPRLLPRDL